MLGLLYLLCTYLHKCQEWWCAIFSGGHKTRPYDFRDHLAFSDMHEASPYDKWDFLHQKLVAHGLIIHCDARRRRPLCAHRPLVHGLLLTATLGGVAPYVRSVLLFTAIQALSEFHIIIQKFLLIDIQNLEGLYDSLSHSFC